MDSSDNEGDFNPQQEEVLPVPTSDVTSSSDTYWQIWKDSSLLKVPEARSSFQSDHQLIRGNPYILHALFHFLKTHICFLYFQIKNLTKQRQQKYSNTSSILKSTPRSPEYCPRLLPFFSTVLTGLSWFIFYIALWLSCGVVWKQIWRYMGFVVCPIRISAQPLVSKHPLCFSISVY